MHNIIPLVFCWSGSDLPNWYYDSLLINSKTANLPIYLLCQNLVKVPDGCTVIPTSDFYKRAKLIDCIESRLINTSRSEFWVSTMERFFILRQFMNHAGLTKCIGAELDNIIIDIQSKFHEVTHRYPSHSLFYPRLDEDRALGSIFFVNGLKALHLFEQAVETFYFSERDANDMRILAYLLSEHPYSCKELPSFESVCIHGNEVYGSSIYDAAMLGQHLAGVDPSIISRPLFNLGSGLVDTSAIPKTGRLVCNTTANTFKLMFIINDTTYTISNIHIHSKCFSWFINPHKLSHLLNRLKKSRRTLIFLNVKNWWFSRLLRHRCGLAIRLFKSTVLSFSRYLWTRK